MTDNFHFPPDRELPDGVRHQARERIVTGLNGDKRVRPMVPVAVAAAVVVLAGATAGLVALTNSGQGTASAGQIAAAGQTTSPATSSNNDAASAAGYVTAQQTYDVLDHSAPADLTARCAAVANEQQTGLPGPSEWSPLFTASADGVSVIAFHTPAGPRFCELTPATVTLSASSPSAPPSGTATPTFRTAFGSVAGVIDPRLQWLHVKATGDKSTKDGQIAVVEDGVFVIPNGVAASTAGLTMTASTAPTAPQQTITTSAARMPALAAATTDRSVPPADQTSTAGHQLTDCFTHAGGAPLIDPAAWTPGASVPLDEHENAQLGRYGNLLAVCVFDSSPTPTVRLEVHNGIDLHLPLTDVVPANPYVITGSTFYDFHATTQATDGGSTTSALVGLTTSDKVASVRVSRPGAPALTGTVHNGTFLVPGMDVNVYGSGTTLTVLDSKGAVLTQQPLQQ